MVHATQAVAILCLLLPTRLVSCRPALPALPCARLPAVTFTGRTEADTFIRHQAQEYIHLGVGKASMFDCCCCQTLDPYPAQVVPAGEGGGLERACSSASPIETSSDQQS